VSQRIHQPRVSYQGDPLFGRSWAHLMTFEEFAASRLTALLRYAAVLTGDQEQARDLVQDVLAQAYAKWSRIERTDRPDAYVHRMVTNAFLNTRRLRRVRVVPLGWQALDGPGLPPQPDHAGPTDDRDEMRQRLQVLPRQQRAVLVLRYYADLPDAEIAEVLGCSVGTVRAHASRALARLRVELDSPARPYLEKRR
jgi:RNA polymerase sigma-70 factor (sigma-E family)